MSTPGHEPHIGQTPIRPGEGRHPGPDTPVLPIHPLPVVNPTHTVSRVAIAAARQAGTPGGGHPAIWQPWQQAIAEAEARMRTEIQQALTELRSAEAAAGKILDTAEGMAKEAESEITAAAWARFHRDMDSAAAVYAAIMDPARNAYTSGIDTAHDRFAKAIATARHGFDSALSAANSAKTLGATLH